MSALVSSRVSRRAAGFGVVLPLVLGFAAGCKRAPSGVHTTGAVDAALGAPAAISASAVTALVQNWVAAQNAGDLAAYRALYTEPFFGIRRSGPRVVTFDQAGWMKDRTRMFRKPQRIGVSSLEIRAAGPERAAVRFTQEWSTATFRDTGTKELSLRQTPAGLRITREELLQSSVLPTEAAGRFLHLVEGDVVVAKDVPEAWAQGAPQVKARRPGWVAGEVEVTYRRLRADKVPERLRGWQGRALRLFGLSGPVCTVAVDALAPASALYLDSKQSLGFDGDTEPGEKEVAAAKWDSGKKLLVAKVRPTSGDCKDAVFARAAELPVPVISKFDKAAPPWLGVGIRAFRSHPLYARIQAHWEHFLAQEGLSAEPPDGGAANDRERPAWLHKAWDEGDDPSWPRQVALARHPLRDGYILSVRSFLSTDPDTLIGTMWAAWELRGKPVAPVLSPLNQPAASKSIAPLAALDVDGDGHLEFLTDYGLLRASSEQPLAYAQTDYLALPKVFSCYAGENDWDDMLGGPQSDP